MTGGPGEPSLVTPVQASGSVALNGVVANDSPTWTAIIPIRSLTEGKSRLMTDGVRHGALVEAFACDVIEACVSCPAIGETIVVSPDPRVHDLAKQRGASAAAEPDLGGINEAISHTIADHSISALAIAILGDTPCLTADVLTAIVDQAASQPVSFVSDASGTGTTIWCARDLPATSHFGEHSRALHKNSGAVELGSGNVSATWARARRDVDTDVDLWDAQRIGVGTFTAAALSGVITASMPADAVQT